MIRRRLSRALRGASPAAGRVSGPWLSGTPVFSILLLVFLARVCDLIRAIRLRVLFFNCLSPRRCRVLAWYGTRCCHRPSHGLTHGGRLALSCHPSRLLRNQRARGHPVLRVPTQHTSGRPGCNGGPRECRFVASRSGASC